MDRMQSLLKYKVPIIVLLSLWIGRGAVSRHLAKNYSVPLSSECKSECPTGSGCEPLSLRFELASPKISLSKQDRIWYRASIKNNTCERLRVLSMRGLVDDSEVRDLGDGLWIELLDQNGKPVRRDGVNVDGGIAWDYGSEAGVAVSTEGVIHPYRQDTSLIQRLRVEKRLNDENFGNLEDGEVFSSVGMVVRPYRIVATSESSGGGMSDGYRLVDVKDPPKYPAPPAGFIELTRFRIEKPGRYKIRAGYKSNPSAYPIYRRWESRPAIVSALFGDAGPAYVSGRELHVDLRVPDIDFEVVR